MRDEFIKDFWEGDGDKVFDGALEIEGGVVGVGEGPMGWGEDDIP